MADNTLIIRADTRSAVSELKNFETAIARTELPVNRFASTLERTSNTTEFLADGLGSVKNSAVGLGQSFTQVNPKFQALENNLINLRAASNATESGLSGLALKLVGLGNEAESFNNRASPFLGYLGEIEKKSTGAGKAMASIAYASKPLNQSFTLLGNTASSLSTKFEGLSIAGYKVSTAFDSIASFADKSNKLVSVVSVFNDLDNTIKSLSASLPGVLSGLKESVGVAANVGIGVAQTGFQIGGAVLAGSPNQGIIGKAETLLNVPGAENVLSKFMGKDPAKMLTGLANKKFAYTMAGTAGFGLADSFIEADKHLKSLYKGMSTLEKSGFDTTLIRMADAVGKLGEGFALVPGLLKEIGETGKQIFIELEDRMRALATLPDVAKEVREKGENVLYERFGNIAKQTKYAASSGELTTGAYQAISAGIVKPEDTDRFVKVATVFSGAQPYNLDQAEVGALLSKTKELYGLSPERSATLINSLFQSAVASPEVISPYLASLFSQAAAAKVAPEEISAVLSASTAGGNAQQMASSGVPALLATLTAPTPQAEQALKELGITGGSVGVANKGIFGLLKEIKNKTGGDIEKMREILPDDSSFRAAQAVLANEKKYTSDKSVSAQGSYEEDVFKQFEERQDSIINKMKRIENQSKELFADWGRQVSIGIKPGLNAVEKLLERFASIPAPFKMLALSAFKIGEWLEKINGAVGAILKGLAQLAITLLIFRTIKIFTTDPSVLVKAFNSARDGGTGFLSVLKGIGGAVQQLTGLNLGLIKSTDGVNKSQGSLGLTLKSVFGQLNNLKNGVSNLFGFKADQNIGALSGLEEIGARTRAATLSGSLALEKIANSTGFGGVLNTNINPIDAVKNIFGANEKRKEQNALQAKKQELDRAYASRKQLLDTDVQQGRKSQTDADRILQAQFGYRQKELEQQQNSFINRYGDTKQNELNKIKEALIKTDRKRYAESSSARAAFEKKLEQDVKQNFIPSTFINTAKQEIDRSKSVDRLNRSASVINNAQTRLQNLQNVLDNPFVSSPEAVQKAQRQKENLEKRLEQRRQIEEARVRDLARAKYDAEQQQIEDQKARRKEALYKRRDLGRKLPFVQEIAGGRATNAEIDQYVEQREIVFEQRRQKTRNKEAEQYKEQQRTALFARRGAEFDAADTLGRRQLLKGLSWKDAIADAKTFGNIVKTGIGGAFNALKAPVGQFINSMGTIMLMTTAISGFTSVITDLVPAFGGAAGKAQIAAKALKDYADGVSSITDKAKQDIPAAEKQYTNFLSNVAKGTMEALAFLTKWNKNLSAGVSAWGEEAADRWQAWFNAEAIEESGRAMAKFKTELAAVRDLVYDMNSAGNPLEGGVKKTKEQITQQKTRLEEIKKEIASKQQESKPFETIPLLFGNTGNPFLDIWGKAGINTFNYGKSKKIEKLKQEQQSTTENIQKLEQDFIKYDKSNIRFEELQKKDNLNDSEIQERNSLLQAGLDTQIEAIKKELAIAKIAFEKQKDSDPNSIEYRQNEANVKKYEELVDSAEASRKRTMSFYSNVDTLRKRAREKVTNPSTLISEQNKALDEAIGSIGKTKTDEGGKNIISDSELYKEYIFKKEGDIDVRSGVRDDLVKLRNVMSGLNQGDLGEKAISTSSDFVKRGLNVYSSSLSALRPVLEGSGDSGMKSMEPAQMESTIMAAVGSLDALVGSVDSDYLRERLKDLESLTKTDAISGKKTSLLSALGADNQDFVFDLKIKLNDADAEKTVKKFEKATAKINNLVVQGKKFTDEATAETLKLEIQSDEARIKSMEANIPLMKQKYGEDGENYKAYLQEKENLASGLEVKRLQQIEANLKAAYEIQKQYAEKNILKTDLKLASGETDSLTAARETSAERVKTLRGDIEGQQKYVKELLTNHKEKKVEILKAEKELIGKQTELQKQLTADIIRESDYRKQKISNDYAEIATSIEAQLNDLSIGTQKAQINQRLNQATMDTIDIEDADYSSGNGGLDPKLKLRNIARRERIKQENLRYQEEIDKNQLQEQRFSIQRQQGDNATKISDLKIDIGNARRLGLTEEQKREQQTQLKGLLEQKSYLNEQLDLLEQQEIVQQQINKNNRERLRQEKEVTLLQRQSSLLGMKEKSINAKASFTSSMYDIAGSLEVNESAKKNLDKEAALAQINFLQKQQAIQQQMLDLEIKRDEIALIREERALVNQKRQLDNEEKLVRASIDRAKEKYEKTGSEKDKEKVDELEAKLSEIQGKQEVWSSDVELFQADQQITRSGNAVKQEQFNYDAATQRGQAAANYAQLSGDRYLISWTKNQELSNARYFSGMQGMFGTPGGTLSREQYNMQVNNPYAVYNMGLTPGRVNVPTVKASDSVPQSFELLNKKYAPGVANNITELNRKYETGNANNNSGLVSIEKLIDKQIEYTQKMAETAQTLEKINTAIENIQTIKIDAPVTIKQEAGQQSMNTAGMTKDWLAGLNKVAEDLQRRRLTSN